MGAWIGLPLYNASAVFIRHTLNALYSDLSVELKRITVNFPGDGDGDGDSRERQRSQEGANEPGQFPKPSRRSREKSVFIALTVSGNARVSGSLGVWDV